MHSRRCYVSTAVNRDLIYAMGGYDGHHRQNTAERYNFKTNQWTLVAPMNMQRSDASATTLNGNLIFSGNQNLYFVFFKKLQSLDKNIVPSALYSLALERQSPFQSVVLTF